MSILERKKKALPPRFYEGGKVGIMLMKQDTGGSDGQEVASVTLCTYDQDN